jgi:hypothetical protein
VRRAVTLAALLWPIIAHAQAPMIPTMNGIHLTTKPLDAGTMSNLTTPLQFNMGPITGTWLGEAGASAPMRVQCYSDTAKSPPGGGIIGCMDLFYTYGYEGAGGTRAGLNVGSLLTGSGTVDNGFHMAIQARATADAPMGGSVYPTKAVGQVDGTSIYAIATGKSGYLANVSGLGEINWEVMHGGASILSNGAQFARLGTDWGHVDTPGANQFQGRYGIWVTSQSPGLDTSSTASMTASSGKNLPGFRSQLVMGGMGQETTFDPDNGAFLFSFPQVYANGNGCTVGVNNCPATIGPAMIKPQTSWDWFQMGNIHINNEVMRSPGFVVKGTGETQVGNLSIKPVDQGGTIDVGGSFISAATYVNGNLANQFQVGELLYGSYTEGTVPGAILKVTAVNGATTPGVTGTPTALQVLDKGYSSAAAAVNNASATMGTAAKFNGHGTNTVTLTWVDHADGGSGKPSISLAPTAGRVTIGSGTSLITMDAGAIISGPNSNIVSGANAGFVSGPSGFQLTDGSGGYGVLGGSGSNMVFKSSSGQNVAYFDMRAAAPQFTFLNPVNIGVIRDFAIVKVTPTSGSTVTVAQNTHTTIMTPAGTLAALTIRFPTCDASTGGQEWRFSTSAAITALTISAVAAGIGPGLPSSLAAGQGFAVICNPGDSGLYRLS